jgi:hypothetical protein
LRAERKVATAFGFGAGPTDRDGSRADRQGNGAATEEIDGVETENRIGIKHELHVRERDKTYALIPC